MPASASDTGFSSYEMTELPKRRLVEAKNPSLCLTECKQYVYLTGSDTHAERFDLRSADGAKAWEILPKMNFARSQHGSCSIGSFVYVFGG